MTTALPGGLAVWDGHAAMVVGKPDDPHCDVGDVVEATQTDHDPAITGPV